VTIAEELLPEFDTEMASTRRVLERLPEDRFGWRPHPRSWTLAELATHVGNLVSWTVHTLGRDELDAMPVDAPPPRATLITSREGLLATFDENVKASHAALAAADDAHMLGPWTLKAGGRTLFTRPRRAVLRSFVLNHLIHHRAQLTVYLRLLEVPLPSIYGPTADDQSFLKGQ
jgi:uncharacterized damage-inducible protein DinB